MSNNHDLTLGVLVSNHGLAKLRSISARLNDPAKLDFDGRRDLANLLDLVLSDAIPVENGPWVVKVFREGRWYRHAVGHAWTYRTEADSQLAELRSRYPNLKLGVGLLYGTGVREK